MKCICNGVLLHWLNAPLCSRTCWGFFSNTKYFSEGKFQGENYLGLDTLSNQSDSLLFFLLIGAGLA